MRHIFPAICCIALLTTACKKTNPTITTLDGTYTGTFQRQQGGGGQVSQVSLTFSGNHWTGTSQYPKYPALCNGTYAISASHKITFANSCPWTAEFDWSLILSHEYELSVTGNDVEMVRTTSLYRDVYSLSK